MSANRRRVRTRAALAVIGLVAVAAWSGDAGATHARSAAPPPEITITGGGGRPLHIGPVFTAPRATHPPVTTATTIRGNRFVVTITAWAGGKGVTSVSVSGGTKTSCTLSGELGQVHQGSFLQPLFPATPGAHPRGVVVLQWSGGGGCASGTWTETDIDAVVTATNASGVTAKSPMFHVHMVR